jgi:hypothetical protein
LFEAAGLDAFPRVLQICSRVRHPAGAPPAPMPHDPLSDVLRAVRLRGAIPCAGLRDECTAETPGSPAPAAALIPGAGHPVDPVMAAPIGLMRAQAAEDRALDEPGHQAGPSRSALRERFAAPVGQPPAAWRRAQRAAR